MEPSFQTSFIPKKPIVRETNTAPQSVGLVIIISIFLLVTILLVSGGLYFYQTIITNKITTMKNNLKLAQSRFEPSKIIELQKLDKRLIAASQVLSKHIAITPIFKALQSVTMKQVRYTNFTYDFGSDKNAKINVKMTGVTLGYNFLALQSDLFNQNKNFIEPVFSNLLLDDKGNVTFELNFSIDLSFVDYKRNLATEKKQIEDNLNNPDNTDNTKPEIGN